MIDAHVHIERGPYTLDWLNQFIEAAVKNGITEIPTASKVGWITKSL